MLPPAEPLFMVTMPVTVKEVPAAVKESVPSPLTMERLPVIVVVAWKLTEPLPLPWLMVTLWRLAGAAAEANSVVSLSGIDGEGVPPTELLTDVRLTVLPLPAPMVMVPVRAKELPPVLKLSLPALLVTDRLPPMLLELLALMVVLVLLLPLTIVMFPVTAKEEPPALKEPPPSAVPTARLPVTVLEPAVKATVL